MFSVLMSVYKNDRPDYLEFALTSIYEKQTRKPNEIVIVFDGPLTDDLYRVIEKFFSDKKDIVKHIELEKNQGLGQALKIGSENCSYEYIMRMDSDDISDSSRFEKQMLYAEQHPSVAVIGTYISEFYNSTDEPDMRIRKVPRDLDGIIKMSKVRNPMNHVTVCIKKSSLLACGGYETLLLLEDYYLWLKMIVAGYNMVNIPESLVYARVCNGFNTKRSSIERIAGWKVIQNYMLEHGLINHFSAIMNMFYIKFFIHMPDKLKQFVYDHFLRS